MSRWAVILAGGSGTRFWPLSTALRPKQLLPLVESVPMLAATVRRLLPLIPVERILVLTGAGTAGAVTALLPDLPRENVIVEPQPRGTAAALGWAARHILETGDGDATMLSVHADWAIGNEPEFVRALDLAATVAERHHEIITVGIIPTRADPGFGYIHPGAPLEPGSQGAVPVYHAARFLEKPDRATAARLKAEGYLWNSGIFAWRVGDFLLQLRDYTPEVAVPLETARDIGEFFDAAIPISVDVGLLERSDRVLVIAGDFGWDDVGTWAALRRVRPTDAAGNVCVGSVHTLDTAASVIYAEEGTVVAYGVSGLVIVARHGLTFVTTIERAAELKTLVDTLPPSLRDPK